MVELGRCFQQSRAPLSEVLAYLQLSKLEYPYELRLKNGGKLALNDWQDLTTAWVVFYGNEYALKPEDRVVLDCGANIGAFSLHCAAYLPELQVVAVEPFPSTFKRLEETIRTNQFEGRIKAINAAVVGQSGPVYMDDAEEIASHSRKVGGDRGIEVEGLSLRDILEAQGIDEADLLKVDIEGAEYALIEQTPPKILRRFKRIGMEYHGNGDTDRLFKKLIDTGFIEGRHPKKGKAGVVEFVRQ